MKFILYALMFTFLSILATPSYANAEMVIKGAGASFPYPLYRWWSLRYNKLSNVRIDYHSIGSGGGLQKILAKEIDFGATDIPLSTKELEEKGLIQFATVLGGVVPVVNLPNIPTGELKLTGSVLADIFMGKISHWAHSDIKKLNPHLTLPNLKISVVHREKASGTTWIFTNYLSKVSTEFKNTIGNAKHVSWPVGKSASGNKGIVKEVLFTEGSIGYTGYEFAVQSEANYAILKNKDGQFIHPNHDSFQAATASVDWSKTNADITLTHTADKGSWPIVGATFILMHKDQPDNEKVKALLDFFEWCYSDEGDHPALMIDYIPIPDELVHSVRKEWGKIQL